MNWTPATLLAECDRFLATYPWLWGLEAGFGLPRGLLLAVGSRETNLTNETGDGGHGHGVWQLDDRSHVIPAGFDVDVSDQAIVAALMLEEGLAARQGNIDQAACMYNSGQPLDAHTAGGDYGTDVVARLAVIAAHYRSPVPALLEDLVKPFIAAVKTGPLEGEWIVTADWHRIAVSDPTDSNAIIAQLGQTTMPVLSSAQMAHFPVLA